MLPSLFLRMPIRAYSVSLVSMTITTIALMFGTGGGGGEDDKTPQQPPQPNSNSLSLSAPASPTPLSYFITTTGSVSATVQSLFNGGGGGEDDETWIGHYYTCKLLELVGITSSSLLEHSKLVAEIIYDTGAFIVILCTVVWLLLLLQVIFIIDVSTNPKYIVMFSNWMHLHRGHGIHQKGNMFIRCNCANKDKAPAEHRGIWEYLVDAPALVFKQYLLQNKIPDIMAWVTETSSWLTRVSCHILTSQAFSGLRHMSLFAVLKLVCIAALWRVGDELYTVIGLPLALFYYTAVAQYWWNCYTTRRIQQATANAIQAGIPNPFNITMVSPLQFQQTTVVAGTATAVSAGAGPGPTYHAFNGNNNNNNNRRMFMTNSSDPPPPPPQPAPVS